MSISPHHFRGVLSNATKLIEEANFYITGKNTQGLTVPVLLKNDLAKCYESCSNAIAELELYINGLNSDSNRLHEYTCVKNELKQKVNELNERIIHLARK